MDNIEIIIRKLKSKSFIDIKYKILYLTKFIIIFRKLEF